MNIKFDINVCRVCLQSSAGKSLLKEKTLLQQFLAVTQQKVTKNDGLPEILCNKCISRLKISYDFKKQSESSEQHLRAFIIQVNDKFTKTVKSNDGLLSEDDVNDILLESGYAQEQEEQPTTSKIEKKGNTQKIIKEELRSNLKKETSEIDEYEGGEEEEDEGEQYVEDQSHDMAAQMLDEEYPVEEIEELEEHNEQQEQEDMEPEVEYITNDIIDEHHIDEIEYEEEESIEEEHLTENLYAETISPNSQKGGTEKPSNRKSNDSKKSSKTRRSAQFDFLHICAKCNKDFSTKTNLLRHMQTHGGGKPYVCPICGNGFTQNGSLKQHMHIHTGERPYKCDICDRGFTQSKTLIFHRRRHTGEKPFHCEYCGVSFRQKDGLKRHELVKHSGKDLDKFPCDICHKILHSKYSLQNHLRKHSGTEGFENGCKCETCGKEFASKTSLHAHNRMHTEKLFKCVHCDQEFNEKVLLDEHIKGKHTGLKPFQCSICQKGYATHVEIMSHMKVHNGKQPTRFTCKFCPKQFALKRSFLTHMRNHSGDTIIYTCEECDIAFDNLRLLKLHRVNQHDEIITDLNECEICSTSFISASDLNDHMAVEHDEMEIACLECKETLPSRSEYEAHVLQHELET